MSGEQKENKALDQKTFTVLLNTACKVLKWDTTAMAVALQTTITNVACWRAGTHMPAAPQSVLKALSEELGKATAKLNDLKSDIDVELARQSGNCFLCQRPKLPCKTCLGCVCNCACLQAAYDDAMASDES